MDLSKVLQNVCLSEKEAKAYIFLLESGQISQDLFFEKFFLSEKECLEIVKSLSQKSVIDVFQHEEEMFLMAISPQNFLKTLETRLEKFQLIIPELSALDNRSEARPIIRFYEGKQGLIDVMEDSLEAQEGILNWNNLSVATDILDDYYPIYIKRKNILNLFVRAICNDDATARDFQKKGKKEQREVRLIPGDKFPFRNEINIYNDKISIISHKEQIGVIIQSKDIVETQRSIFKLAWEYAGLLRDQEQNKNS